MITIIVYIAVPGLSSPRTEGYGRQYPTFTPPNKGTDNPIDLDPVQAIVSIYFVCDECVAW